MAGTTNAAQQLRKLAELRAQGVATGSEIAAARATVLASTRPGNSGGATLAVAAGFVAVIIGSIGPWVVASPLSSVSGFDRYGRITLVAAAIGIFLELVQQQGWAMVLGLTASTIGIYEAIAVHETLRHERVFALQIGHLGWGLYVLIVGGVIAAVGASSSRRRAS
jgi:hypothetical protein